MNFLKRIAMHLLNGLLVVVTLGIYGIILLVAIAKGNRTLSMRLLGIDWENSDKAGGLCIMNSLVYILWFVTFGIMLIIDIIFMVSGQRTFGEKWVDNAYTF